MQEKLNVILTPLKNLQQKYKGDNTIWTIIILLWILSILIVYSASGFMVVHQNITSGVFLKKQLFFIIIGFIVVYVTHKINYVNYLKYSFGLYIFCIICLFITLLVGIDINGARRWINIPFVNIQFQPSDLAKIGLILFLSKKISLNQEKIINYKSFFIKFILPILIIILLIIKENLSTSILIFITGLLLLFIGKVQIKYIIYTIFLFIIIPFIIIISISSYYYDKETKNIKELPVFLQVSRVPTWIRRVQGYIYDNSQTKNYQIQQANIAIARGGIVGVGPGNSEQRYFLPSAYADYIFSILIEEYGMLGGIFIIIIYLIFYYRSIKIFIKCDFAFGALVVVGLSTMLVLQALLNICVNIGLMPNTGISLPLISMGGTSYLVSCFSIGIILSVAKNSDYKNNSNLEPL